MHTLIQRIITIACTLVILLTSNAVLAEQDKAFTQMLDDVDKMHQDFSKHLYQALLKQTIYNILKYPSPIALEEAIKKEHGKQVEAIALIVNNLDMLREHYDDPALFPIIQRLLDANEFTSANVLLNAIKAQGDDTLSPQADYLLAGFYFKRQQWEKTLEQLKSDMSFLGSQRYHHALLMKGIALQKLTDHAQAIQVYEKIPSSSENYTVARLNLAIANIRQGWWTDGHNIIRALLKSQQNVPSEKTLNRLYITLAYSLLNQGYYRTARSTFQQVGINSEYANQAALGIVLTAAQQDDDIGALNAIRYLKERTQDELPVHESYLLMPFFYEKSHQLIAASVGYGEATDYYTEKINLLKATLNSPFDLRTVSIKNQDMIEYSIEGHTINFSQHYPRYFFQNRTAVQAFQKYIDHDKLQQQYQQLNNSYNQITIKMSKNILQKRIDNLNSYLNQSRYGLARLFDNNTAG